MFISKKSKKVKRQSFWDVAKIMQQLFRKLTGYKNINKISYRTVDIYFRFLKTLQVHYKIVVDPV